MEISVPQARIRNAINYPVHWPLNNVVVKEGEYDNQKVLRGIIEEGDKYVRLAVGGEIFGGTAPSEGWGALVAAELIGSKYSNAQQRMAGMKCTSDRSR